MDKIKSIIIKFKGLTAIGIATIVSNAISGLLWLYLARLLGTENYGIVSYLIAISAITTTISFLGSGNALIVYTAKEVKIQSPIYFITIFAAAISSIVLFVIFHNIGVSLFVLGNVLFGLVTSELLGSKSYKKYSVFLITQKALMVGFSILLYYFMGYNGVVLGIALSFFPTSIMMTYQRFRGAKFDFSLIRSRLGFIVNSYILDLARTFSGSTDKLIVAPMLGFALLGNYQLGVQVLSVLGMLPAIVFQYTLGQDASGHSNKKLKRLTIVSSVILAILGIALAPKVVPVFFPKFTEVVPVIQIMSLSVIPNTVNLTYISKLLGDERIRIVLIGSVIFLTTQISMIFLLGKIFGLNGVAASFLLAAISETVYLLSVNYFIHRKVSSVIKESTSNSEFSLSNTGSGKLGFLEKNPIISLLTICAIGLFLRLYFFPYKIPLVLDSLYVYFFYASDITILGHFPYGNITLNNGWPLFLSFFFSIFHFNNVMDYMMLQRLISVSLSVLTIIPVYFLCKKFFNRSYAIIGAAIFAFEPRIIQIASFGIAEPLYIFLIAVALVMFLSSNKKLIYVSFAIIGYVALVRVEGLILFIPFTVMYLLRFRNERKMIMKYSLAVGLFLLVITPMAALRIEYAGQDSLTSRIAGDASNLMKEASSHDPTLHTQITTGPKIFATLLGWSMIPIFIFFVPTGIIMIFRRRTLQDMTIIVIIISLLVAAFYAYFSLAPDTRYFYPLYPALCVVSLFTIRRLADKFTRHDLFLVLVIAGILSASLVYFDFKNYDFEHQRESFGIAKQVVSIASGVNDYYPEDNFLMPAQLPQKWPILSSSIAFHTSRISTNGFDTLQEYIKSSKDKGLTHLVVDDNKNRLVFISDVFYHPEKYPYLIEVYDSSNDGYRYHVKIFKIDYEAFNSFVSVSKHT